MTLLSTQVLQTYLCDNITTVFPVPFPFFDKDEFLAIKDPAMTEVYNRVNDILQ